MSSTFENSSEIEGAWKSATCVASFYEKYVEIMQKHEDLKSEFLHLQNQRDSLAQQNDKLRQQKQQFISDAETQMEVCHEVKQLRKEKQQLKEQLKDYDRQYSKLEDKMVEMTGKYAAQMKKYNQQYAMDPHSRKREALSIRTLQKTIDSTAKEREETLIQLASLRNEFAQVYKSDIQSKALLDELQHGQQSIQKRSAMNIMVQIYKRKIHFSMLKALFKWKCMAENSMIIEHTALEMNREKEQIKLDKELYQRKKIADFVDKKFLCMKSSVLISWKKCTSMKAENRKRLDYLCEKKEKHLKQRSFFIWKNCYFTTTSRLKSSKKISCIILAHKLKKGFRHWLAVKNNLRYNSLVDSYNEMVVAVDLCNQSLIKKDEEISQMKIQFNEADSQHIVYKEKQEEIIKNLKEHLHCSLNNISMFLANRHIRKCSLLIFHEWRFVVEKTKRLVANVNRMLQYSKSSNLQRSIQHWRSFASEKKDFVFRTKKIMSIFRDGLAVRCMHNWKIFATRNKSIRMSVCRHVLKYQQKFIFSVYERWKQYVLILRLEKKKLLIICGHFEKLLLFRSFDSWLANVKKIAKEEANIVLKKERENKIEEIIALKEKEKYCSIIKEHFLKWKLLNVKIETRKQKILQMNEVVKSNLKCFAVKSWKIFCKCQLRKRYLLSKIIKRLSKKFMYLSILALRNNINFVKIKESRDRNLELEEYSLKLETQLQEYDALITELKKKYSIIEEDYEDIKRKNESNVQVLTDQREQLFEKLLNSWMKNTENKSKHICFTTWQKTAEVSRRNRIIIKRFTLYWKNQGLMNVFFRWHEYSRRKNRDRVLITRYHLKTRQKTISTAYEEWRVFSCTERKNRLLISKMIDRIKFGSFERSFLRWKKFNKQRKKQRKAFSNFELCVCTYLCRSYYAIWKVFAHEAKLFAEDKNKKEKMSRLACCFSSENSRFSKEYFFKKWKTWISNKKIKKITLNLRINQLSSRRVQFLFRKWKEFVDIGICTRMLLRKIIIQYEGKQILLYFESWKKFQRLSLELELKNTRIMCSTLQQNFNVSQDLITKMQDKLNYVLNSNKMIKLNYRNAIIKQHRLKALTLFFSSWQQHTAGKTRQTRILLKFINQIRFHSAASSFRRWCCLVAESRKNFQVAESYYLKLQRSRLNNLFCLWHSCVVEQKRNRMVLLHAIKRIECLSTTKSFRSWIYFTYNRKTLREFFIKYYTMNLQYGLSAWKWGIKLIIEEQRRERVDRTNEKLQLLFIARNRESSLSAHFQVWRMLHHKLNRIKRFISRHIASSLSLNFSLWKFFSFRRRELRLHILCIFRQLKNRYLKQFYSFWKSLDTVSKIEELKEKTSNLLSDNQNLQEEVKTQTDHSSQLRDDYNSLKEKYFVLSTQRNKDLLKRTKEKEKFIKSFAKRTILVWSSKQLLHFYKRWRRYVIERQLVKRFLKKWETKELLRSFSAWNAYVDRKVSIQTRCKNFLKAMLAQNERSVFLRWRKTVQIRKKCKTIVFNYLNEIVLGSQKRAFKTWYNIMMTYRYLEKNSTVLKKLKSCGDELNRSKFQFVLSKLLFKIAESSTLHKFRCFNKWKVAIEDKFIDVSTIEEDSTIFSWVKNLTEYLVKVQSLQDVFNAIAYGISGFRTNISGVLYLLDKEKQELWSYVNDGIFVNFPSHIGIAGCVATEGNFIHCRNISFDSRFHPLIDQYSLMKPQKLNEFGSTQRYSMLAKPAVFSYPIKAATGAIFGVVQVSETNYSSSVSNNAIFICVLCSYYVRNYFQNLCQDSMKLPPPRSLEETFQKKYSMESNLNKFEHRVRELEQMKIDAENKRKVLENELEKITSKKNSKRNREVNDLKEKLRTVEAELEDKCFEVLEYKRLERAKEISFIASPHNAFAQKASKNQTLQQENRLKELTTDIANLKNELTRSESDNYFLANTVKTAIHYNGKLPQAMLNEALRITNRLK